MKPINDILVTNDFSEAPDDQKDAVLIGLSLGLLATLGENDDSVEGLVMQIPSLDEHMNSYYLVKIKDEKMYLQIKTYKDTETNPFIDYPRGIVVLRDKPKEQESTYEKF